MTRRWLAALLAVVALLATALLIRAYLSAEQSDGASDEFAELRTDAVFRVIPQDALLLDTTERTRCTSDGSDETEPYIERRFAVRDLEAQAVSELEDSLRRGGWDEIRAEPVRSSPVDAPPPGVYLIFEKRFASQTNEVEVSVQAGGLVVLRASIASPSSC